MLKNFYLALGLLVIMFYGTASFMGWEMGTPARETLPADARGPNGYRSFHFWHYGFRGGK